MLSDAGDTVTGLSRSDFADGKEAMLASKIEGADVVINLAGATINRRWTKQYKADILNSRVETTDKIVAAINSLKQKPKLFISTSAIGLYPSTGSFPDTSDTAGDGFLSGVCHLWESAAKKVSPDVRLVITRFAPVLAADGGIFPPLVKLFKLRLGGRIGSGRQTFCWIMRDDLMNIYKHIISDAGITGAVNCASPGSTDNRAFTVDLAQALRVAAPWMIPAFMLRAILGERAEMLTEGQNAIPYKLGESGFKFGYPDIKAALAELCKGGLKG